ncbi:hypothetical protein F2P81_021493 [Scophthalmus maximus]|uniref:Solute carrier family 15 member 2-like n=1 Tax=Scophthalmus maximus TaxID=52904 RepID=A0A6A4RVI0_SCOMX|nr:hypothetical protein F2P81_021493 [Scophthalmus maximus]
MNALLILLFVPIFDLIVYPLVGLCRINLTPLRKIAAGMVFAALAFGAATLVELNVVKTVVDPAPSGSCLLQAFNLAEGNVTVKIPDSNLFPEPIQYLQNLNFNPPISLCQDPPQYETLPLGTSSEELKIQVTYSGATSVCNQTFEEQKAYSLILYSEATGIQCKLASGKLVARTLEDVKANNVHIVWQIPQYVLITAGEVMFSITGLEFSYSQAPANMKSVLQAAWLLTVAFGNVIVLIVAEGAGLEQWKEFLLFAGLLLGVCIIFSIMCCFYTYVDPDQLDNIYLAHSGKDVEVEDDAEKNKYNGVDLNKTAKTTRL